MGFCEKKHSPFRLLESFGLTEDKQWSKEKTSGFWETPPTSDQRFDLSNRICVDIYTSLVPLENTVIYNISIIPDLFHLKRFPVGYKCCLAPGFVLLLWWPSQLGGQNLQPQHIRALDLPRKAAASACQLLHQLQIPLSVEQYYMKLNSSTKKKTVELRASTVTICRWPLLNPKVIALERVSYVSGTNLTQLLVFISISKTELRNWLTRQERTDSYCNLGKR